MKRTAMAALGLFALTALLGYFITSGPKAPRVLTKQPTAGSVVGPVADGGAVKAEEIAQIDRLEKAVLEGVDTRAVVFLADGLRYLTRLRQNRLERYWEAACDGGAGERYLPVLKRYRREAVPFVTRSLAREPRKAVRNLDLARRMYGRRASRLDGAFDANARRAVAGLLFLGLGQPYDKQAVGIRLAALRFVDHFGLKEAAEAVETLARKESYLRTRTQARVVWSRLTGKNWSGRPKGKDGRGRGVSDMTVGAP